MTSETIIAAVGLYAGAFVIGAISSIIPIICIEVFVVALVVADVVTGIGAATAIVLLATAGQVIGKLPVYATTRGLVALPGRHQIWVERSRAWVARFGNRPLALIGTSAFVGLPPFSLVSTAAGFLAVPLRSFCATIAMGRAARFGVLMALAW